MLGEGNLIFDCTGSRDNYFGSASRQNDPKFLVILSFSVSTSKNKNVYHRVTETCAIMSTQVLYETNHSVLRFNNIKCTTNLCFLCILL